MLDLQVDLHIHTVLSPCAEIEMIPPLIVRRAQELGLDIIAITDHNALGNAGAVIEAARDTGITVLPGMEVQTREEVHLLCLFDMLSQAQLLDALVAGALPDKLNQEEFFGAQYIVDAAANYIRTEQRLLATSTSLTVEQVVDKVNALNGICLPAHIDRPSFSLLTNLGFVPPELAISGIELSPTAYKHPNFAPFFDKGTKNVPEEPRRDRFSHGSLGARQERASQGPLLTTSGKSIQLLSGLAQHGVIVNSDAHRLEEIGVRTQVHAEAPTISELRRALRKQQGRRTDLVPPPK